MNAARVQVTRSIGIPFDSVHWQTGGYSIERRYPWRLSEITHHYLVWIERAMTAEMYRYWIELRDVTTGSIREIPLQVLRRVYIPTRKDGQHRPDEEILRLQDGELLLRSPACLNSGYGCAKRTRVLASHMPSDPSATSQPGLDTRLRWTNSRKCSLVPW
jgi:hypothetical protein